MCRKTSRHPASRRTIVGAAVCVLAAAGAARATWSIVIVDTETKEFAVGSATCLTGFDLEHELPIVIVDVGAACAQSRVDSGAINRMRIHEQFLLGTPPEEILEYLRPLDSSHEDRQYGIVDALGRAATFTGSGAGSHASGVTGRTGSLVYSIQGNVLTGAPVVLDAEQAVINTPGELPEKLMAAMQAARAMGGDGRCSCSTLGPEICGVPPNGGDFTKAAHVGFMIVTRAGDTSGVCNGADGCANGDYYMQFNVPNQTANDPDPVEQLQAMFDQWRADLVGQPDAKTSTGEFSRPWVRADFEDTVTMRVTTRDWLGTPVTSGPLFAEVSQAPESDGRTLVFTTQDLGGGVFEVPIGLATTPGRDRFRVTLTGTGRPAVILPLPELLVVSLEDIDADGEVDLADHAVWAGCLEGPDGGVAAGCEDADIDRNGHVDLADFARLQSAYTNELCEALAITQQPLRADLCVGDPLTLSVGVQADPEVDYQWLHYGVPIPGQTGPSFSIDAVTEADQGYYEVEVSNTCGTVVSDRAAVRVSMDACP